MDAKRLHHVTIRIAEPPTHDGVAIVQYLVAAKSRSAALREVEKRHISIVLPKPIEAAILMKDGVPLIEAEDE